MLVKCVCSACGHSFLADDQASMRLECPRCNAENGAGGAGPEAADDVAPDQEVQRGGAFHETPAGFAPKALPPMYITRERLVRGLVLGGLGAAILGAAVGAALAAVRVAVPVAAALLLGFGGGAVCRYGLGSRTIRQTRGRARFAVAWAVLLAFSGLFAGGWAVERMTGSRADVTRRDLDAGLDHLLRKRGRTQDEGEKMLLQQRIVDVEALRRKSSAELEDYLWMQEAQLRPGLLAYSSLRAANGPFVKLGPDAQPMRIEKSLQLAALGAEMLVAFLIAVRAILPRRLRTY
jgi:hypothetical protein